MHETNETTKGIPASGAAAPAGAKATDRATPGDRLGLIRALQEQALRRADPLAANLEVISGDLMLFAYRIRESVEANLAASLASADRCEQFTKQAEMYLRFVRQIDRLAQIERQLARAPEPAKAE